MFGGFSSGSWSLSSKSDPRWNCSGHVEIMSVFSEPEEVTKKIKKLTEKYGTPPEDLEYSCMKD